MKIIKKYDINSLFVCVGLLASLFTSEVKAMRMSPEGRARVQQYWKNKKHVLIQPEEKFYKSAWEQDLDNLSNNENWDDNGFPMQKWIEKAIEDAIELIEEDETTIEELIGELDDKLKSLREVKNQGILNAFKKALNVKIASKEQRFIRKQDSARRKEDKKNQQKQQDLQKSVESLKKFEQQLQPNAIGKGWFRGPSKQWVDQIILLAADGLKPNVGQEGYSKLVDDIVDRIRLAMYAYDAMCYFHVDSEYINKLCNSIASQLKSKFQQ